MKMQHDEHGKQLRFSNNHLDEPYFGDSKALIWNTEEDLFLNAFLFQFLSLKMKTTGQ